jgi:hypothetical protein
MVSDFYSCSKLRCYDQQDSITMAIYPLNHLKKTQPVSVAKTNLLTLLRANAYLSRQLHGTQRSTCRLTSETIKLNKTLLIITSVF